MKKQEALNKIQELRSKGYKVHVNHFRMVESGFIPQLVPQRMSKEFDFLPKGGKTEVVVLKDTQVVAKEESHCSILDNYEKGLGVRICIGRLCKAGKLDNV